MAKEVLHIFGPRVLIQPDEPIDRVGSVLLAQKAQVEPTRGHLVAVGECEGMPYEVGQYVLFNKYAGEEIKSNDVAYRLLPVKDVFAVITMDDGSKEYVVEYDFGNEVAAE